MAMTTLISYVFHEVTTIYNEWAIYRRVCMFNNYLPSFLSLALFLVSYSTQSIGEISRSAQMSVWCVPVRLIT